MYKWGIATFIFLLVVFGVVATTFAIPPDPPDMPWQRDLGENYILHMTPNWVFDATPDYYYYDWIDWPSEGFKPSGLYYGDELVYKINSYFGYTTSVFFSDDKMSFFLFYPPYYSVDMLPELHGRRISGRVHQFYVGDQVQIFRGVERFYFGRENNIAYLLRIITLDERDIMFDLQSGIVLSDEVYEGDSYRPSILSYALIGLFIIAMAGMFLWSSTIKRNQRIYYQHYE